MTSWPTTPVGPNVVRAVKFREKFPDVTFLATADHAKPIAELGDAVSAAGLEINVFLIIESSFLAYGLLLGVLEERFPIILTEPIVLEYLDVLVRPAVRALTGLTRRQSEDLVTDLIALSRKVQVRFSWRPNLKDEGDNKFVEAAIHTAAVIATYNVSDYRSPDVTPHGWTVMTPQEFLARYS